MLTKHDCSLYHAKQMLNLTLTGIVNESSDQLGILYEYDANATHPAELANLAYDVLKAVPVLSTYHNSPTGNAPRIADRLVKKSMGELLAGIDWWNLKDWIDTIKEMWARLISWFESLIEAFLDLLSDLVAFVMDAVQKVAEALGSLVQAVAEAGLTLVKAMAAAAMEALENLLKAALLAIIYTIFALIIFGLTFAISSMALMFLPLTLLTGGDLTYTPHSVKMDFLDSVLEMKYKLFFSFNEFLDIEVPSILFQTMADGKKMLSMEIGLFPPFFNFNMRSASPKETSLNSDEENQSDDLRSSSAYESIASNDCDLEIIKPQNDDLIFEFPEIIPNIPSYPIPPPALTDILFELDVKNGQDIYFEYRIERIDTAGPPIEGTLQPRYDEESGKNIYNTTKRLGEGKYILSLKGFNKTTGNELSLTKNVTFTVIDGIQFIDGINVGLSMGAYITAAAVSAHLVGGSRYTFGIFLAGLGISVSFISGLIGSLLSGEGYSKYSWLLGFGTALTAHGGLVGVVSFLGRKFGKIIEVEGTIFNMLWALSAIAEYLDISLVGIALLFLGFGRAFIPPILKDFFDPKVAFALLGVTALQEYSTLYAVYFTSSLKKDWKQPAYIMTFALIFFGFTVIGIRNFIFNQNAEG